MLCREKREGCGGEGQVIQWNIIVTMSYYQCIPILDYSFQIIFHGVMIIYIKIDGGCLWGEKCDEEDQSYDIELLWN